MRLVTGAACAFLLAAGVAACGAGSFTLGRASVDATYACPAGSNHASYELRATIDADNGTSQAVQVRSATAVLVVADVHGLWRQKVGTAYDAGQAAVSPATVGAGSKTKLALTIASSCSNGAHSGVNDNYADYSVKLTVVTSAGTFKLTSENKHRITAP